MAPWPAYAAVLRTETRPPNGDQWLVAEIGAIARWDELEGLVSDKIFEMQAQQFPMLLGLAIRALARRAATFDPNWMIDLPYEDITTPCTIGFPGTLPRSPSPELLHEPQNSTMIAISRTVSVTYWIVLNCTNMN